MTAIFQFCPTLIIRKCCHFIYGNVHHLAQNPTSRRQNRGCWKCTRDRIKLNHVTHVPGIPNVVYSCQQEDTSSVRLLNAAMVNGYSIVTYQRPLKAQDELDIDIRTNGSQPVIWAIGPLNSKNEVSYHTLTNKSAFRCHCLCNAPLWLDHCKHDPFWM